MTIIRNKQTGLEIEGERVVAYSDIHFNFRITGTAQRNSFRYGDWDIINTPEDGFYIWALPGVIEDEPHPAHAIHVYQDGLWSTLDRKTGSGSPSDIQNAYERGELRRLTFAKGD